MSEFVGETKIVVRADTGPFLFRVKKDIEVAEKNAATIVVKANTKLFRSQVRAVAAETNQFVKASVIVNADTRAFKFGVKRAVAEVQKTPVLLDVNADVRALRANIISALERSKRGLAFSIPVRVDPKGLRAQLIETVKRAEKGVTAKVGVIASGPVTGVAARAATAQPGAAAAAPVAAPAGVDRRTASALSAINAATDAGVAARRRLSGELSVEEKRSARLTRELASLRAAQEAVRRSVLSNNKALIAQAEDLQRTAAAAVQSTRAQQERAAARTPEARAAAIEQQAAAELAARRKLESDITRAHGDALRENSRLDKEAQIKLSRLHAEALEADKRRDAQARQARQAAIGPTAQTAALAENKQRDVITKQLAASVEKQAEAQAKLTNVAKGGIAIEERGAEVKRIQATALGAVTNAEKALAAARTTGNQVLIATTEAELGRAIAAREANAATLTDVRSVAEAEKLLARSIKTSVGVQQEVVGAKNAEDAANRKLNVSKRALAQVNEAEAAALQIVNTELREEVLLRVAAQKAVASQTATDVASAARRVGANKSVRESIFANTLSLLGLRGSALAANAAFLGTSAVIISLAKSVGLASKLQSQLSVFEATAGATADQMERVGATAEQLGRDISLPGVNATDAAEALTELSKAGLSVQDSIDGARGVLQLATAASIDNAQATELAASALNAFGLSGNEAVHVADVLANAANDSQGSIVDVGTALQQSAAVAHQAGLSLEQTVSVLTLFARAGLRGSDAGTSFRTALIRLINPTTKAQKEVDKLGLHLRTASGAINLNVFDEFAKKTRNLTAAQRDQSLAIIFGQDAIRGAAILARNGAKGLDAQRLSLEKQGTAAELASARMSGLTGATANLQNQLASLGLVLGQVVSIGLVPMVNGFANALSVINKLAQGIIDLGNQAGKLPGILGDAREELDKLFGGKGGGGQQQPRLKVGKIEVDDKDAKDQILGFIGFASNQFTNFFKNVALIPVGPVRPLFDLITPDPKTVNQARNQVKGLVSDFNKVGGLSQLDDSVRRLKKLSAEMRNGDDKSKAFAKDLDIFIERIQKVSANPKIDPFELSISIPPELLSGDPGRLLGEANKKEFLKAIFTPPSELAQAFGLTGLENVFNKFDITGLIGVDPKVAFDKFKNGFADAAAAAARDMRKARAKVDAVIGRSEGRVSGLERSGVDLELAGAGDPTLLKNANAKIAAQAKVIAQEENRRNQILEDTGKESNQRLRAAKEKQAQFIKDRDGILASMKSDADQAKKDAQDKRDKADQTFLDALVVGRTPFSRAIERAQSTPGANDNVNTLLAFRKRLQDEVTKVKAGVQDSKTKAAALQKLSDELFQNAQDINAARKARNEAIQQAFADRGTAIQSLGETTGNFRLILRGLDLQIDAARQTLIKARAAKVGVDAARAALAALQKSRRDMINDARNSLLDQAFSLQEARGNKSGMLQIIDLQIKQARAEEKQAKTLLDRLVAQTKIAELIAKRKEILADEIEKGTKGTTAFDLLKQFSDRFNDIAGNLINADQPFAGPTGFTADIAQFLKRRKGPGGLGGVTSDFRTHDPNDLRFGQPKNQADKQTATTNALIAALDKLTTVILSESGNDGTGGKATGTVKSTKGNPWAGRRWFVESHAARGAQEG